MATKTKTKTAKRKPGRPPKDDILPGMIFGYLKIHRKRTTKPPSFECICIAPVKRDGDIVQCGNHYNVRRAYLLRKEGPTTHCGCQTNKDANPYPREYSIWYMLRKRCYDPTHISYKYYGALGVGVHPRYHHDNPEGFKNFVADLGPAPSKRHTLDRKDPRKNYEPGNLRWATPLEQAANKRARWIGKPL